MTDFRSLCAELADSIELLLEMREGPPMQITEDRLTRARAALAETVVMPTVMEIIELADQIEAAELGQVDLVRMALARYDTTTPAPVSVSERLPGAEDCDAEGRCWWLSQRFFTWSLESPPVAQVRGIGRFYWLPHWAIPLPQEVGE